METFEVPPRHAQTKPEGQPGFATWAGARPSGALARLVEHVKVLGRGREGYRLSRGRRVAAADLDHHHLVVGAPHMRVRRLAETLDEFDKAGRAERPGCIRR